MTHMYTAKHTPGPWVVNIEGRMIEAQLPNLRNEYEHICDLRGGIKGQINLGNAHLIAAAPAMYKALRALVEVFPSVVKMTPYGVPMSISKIHDNAVAALAQAEGKQ